MALTLISPERAEADGPLIFLAGPIQGADDWQRDAMRTIRGLSDTVHIASPRRYGISRREFSEDMYNEQIDWEHHYLVRAMRQGAVLFWLAKEAVHDSGRAYAQTTRFELGEAVTMHRLLGANVVVGIEKGFTNARYLRRTIAKKTPAVPVLDTLEDVCAETVRIALASSTNPRIDAVAL